MKIMNRRFFMVSYTMNYALYTTCRWRLLRLIVRNLY